MSSSIPSVATVGSFDPPQEQHMPNNDYPRWHNHEDNRYFDRFFKGDYPFFYSTQSRAFSFRDSQNAPKVFVNQTGDPILYARLSGLNRSLLFLQRADTVVLYDDFEEVSQKMAIEVNLLDTLFGSLNELIKEIEKSSKKNVDESKSSSEDEDDEEFADIEESSLNRALESLDLSTYFRLLDAVKKVAKTDKKSAFKLLALQRTNILKRFHELYETVEKFGKSTNELPNLMQDKVCFFSKDYFASLNYQLNDLSLLEGDNYPKYYRFYERPSIEPSPDKTIVLSENSQKILQAHAQLGKRSLRAMSPSELFVKLNLWGKSLFKATWELRLPRNAQNQGLFNGQALLANGYAYVEQELLSRGLTINEEHLFLHPEDLKRSGGLHIPQRKFMIGIRRLEELQTLRNSNPNYPEINQYLQEQAQHIAEIKKKLIDRTDSYENHLSFSANLRAKAYTLLNERTGKSRHSASAPQILALRSLDEVEEREKIQAAVERARRLANRKAAPSATSGTIATQTSTREFALAAQIASQADGIPASAALNEQFVIARQEQQEEIVPQAAQESIPSKKEQKKGS